MRRFFSLFLGRGPGLTAPAFLCLCLSFSATGQQKPASTPPALLPDVSKEALVWDKMHTRIREEADGTGTHETSARIRILADAGVKEMAVLTFTINAGALAAPKATASAARVV